MTARVALPGVPFWENDVVVADPALLDAFARAYVAGTDGAPDVSRFLYGWLPVRAFDEILGGTVPDGDVVAGLLWCFHLSGYFGGVWLRGELDRAQPGAHNVADVRIEPGRDGFLTTVAVARAALDAAAGDDRTVLAYNEASLFPTGEGALTDGLVDNFGYNQGYMLEILASPPAGVAVSGEYDVRCSGPLSCSYANRKLAALADLADVEAALASGAEPAYADLARRIEPVQAAAVPRGRGVWSDLLSVQGFDQQAYDQLLDVSSSYLEDVQATALATVKAVAERDVETGRRAAIANAAMAVWLAGYTAGLVEGRDPSDVPVLVVGD